MPDINIFSKRPSHTGNIGQHFSTRFEGHSKQQSHQQKSKNAKKDKKVILNRPWNAHLFAVLKLKQEDSITLCFLNWEQACWMTSALHMPLNGHESSASIDLGFQTNFRE